MKRATRGLIIYVLIFIGILMLARLMNIGSTSQAHQLTYTSFVQLIKDDRVSHVAVTEDSVIGLYRNTVLPEDTFPNQFDFEVVSPASYSALIRDINAIYAEELSKPVDEISVLDYKFELINVPATQIPIWVEWIPFIIAIVLFGVLWVFLMRSQQGSNSKVMSFGKSRARLMDQSKNPVTFADVAGADEEKEELQEIVEFLKNPKKFLDLGARIPKGILLIGMPGTGKTLLAKAVAGEAGVPFFSISGSDFVEMFVGVGASRVRDLFDQAKKQSPAIVFIDEIDAVGRQRGAGLGGGHDEREQTLNQLLVEMDGFSPNEGVIVIAATNRADILDPALLRPGRFDRQVTVHYPDIKGREAILRVHARNKPLDSSVDLSILARSTPFFTGADLENVLNEAAILAARGSKHRISMQELEEAITRVQMGPEKRSRQITDQDKNLVAYHEAGHAVVAWSMPNCDPVHEVSIIPRGGAGGYTMTLPEQEVHYTSSRRLLDNVTMMLGGHVAEELVLGDVSTGSTSDLKRATETVHKMITQYGMSKQIGPIYLGGDQEVFIGRDFTSNRNYSEEVAAAIDEETRNIVGKCYEKARNVLTEYRAQLDDVAHRLVEKEKIDRDEFDSIMRGDNNLLGGPTPSLA